MRECWLALRNFIKLYTRKENKIEHLLSKNSEYSCKMYKNDTFEAEKMSISVTQNQRLTENDACNAK